MEKSVLGLDTLTKIVEKMRADSAQVPVCEACTINLEGTGYKVCVASTTSMETQTNPCEFFTQEPIDDVADTQEWAVEREHSMGGDLGADTQEHIDKTIVTQKLAVEAEFDQGWKEESNTQELIDDIVVT